MRFVGDPSLDPPDSRAAVGPTAAYRLAMTRFRLPFLPASPPAHGPTAGPGRGCKPQYLIAGVALWLAGPANWPLWRALAALPEVSGPRGLAFGLALGVIIAGLLTALLGALAWRVTLKPVAAFLLIAAAVGAHFMGTYGIAIDPTMIVNVLATDVRETRDLLSVRMVLTILLLGLLPAWWMMRLRVDHGPWRARLLRSVGLLALGLVTVVAVGLLVFKDLSSAMRNHKTLRYLINPLSSVYSLGHVAWAQQRRPSGPPLAIGLDARPLPPQPGQRPPLLILVVGETARADHFSLNGYARDTNPGLRPLDVLSFRDVTSCGTNTATSLPCMVSHQGREAHLDRDHDSETLLDLLHRAGLAVLWLDNQSGCKGVCDRIPNSRPEVPPPGGDPPDERLCPRGECYDEALLHGLDERLAALPAERRARGVVLALHQMGSHGPAYSRRSPEDRKPFQPECTKTSLPQCDHDSLINAYDNSIAYTDHLLTQAIGWLGGQAAAYDPSLLYLSDHGESLGERGLYLHGVPYAVAPREQTHVPMIAWMPPQTLQSDRIDIGCLRGRLDLPLSHDHLFHTVLGLARVEAGEYRRELDAVAPCRER